MQRPIGRQEASPRLVKGSWIRSAFRRLPAWVQRLARIGVLPSDSEELRVRKEVLTLSTAVMASAAFVWVGTYAALGLWASAAIPFAYQLASAASIVAFARTLGTGCSAAASSG